MAKYNLSEKIKGLNVLYEDNHIIAVLKEENILCQKDITEDLDILTIVKAYLKEKYNKEGNVYLGLVHRLDRRVGGVLVLAKTSKAASRLSEDFRLDRVTKGYLALVLGKVKDKKKRLINNLEKVNKEAVESEKGKEAILDFKVLKYINKFNIDLTLVDIALLTGRYNQIRKQFALYNHPILNDYKYSLQEPNKLQLGLWCYKIGFFHPTTKEYIEIINKPNKGIWSDVK